LANYWPPTTPSRLGRLADVAETGELLATVPMNAAPIAH
jgi:hypothetical protein